MIQIYADILKVCNDSTHPPSIKFKYIFSNIQNSNRFPIYFNMSLSFQKFDIPTYFFEKKK